MKLGIGEDFTAARSRWLYQPDGAPNIWVAIGCAIALIVVLALMQTATGFAAYTIFFDASAEAMMDQAKFQNDFTKAAMVGLFPAGLATVLAAWFVSRRASKTPPRGMPLHVPDLGIAGWLLLIVGFCAVVMAVYFGLFAITGIDPSTYAPTADGTNSSAGLVEKALADLADEPLLFALAVPGVALAVPIAEEMIFRGPLFAALAKSPVGRWGAVILTAAVWAAIHVTAPWMFVAIIFAMGVILGALLLRFGSVLVTIVCHCIWNSYSAFAILGGLATQS